MRIAHGRYGGGVARRKSERKEEEDFLVCALGRRLYESCSPPPWASR